MSGFCGWIGPTGSGDPARSVLERMAATLVPGQGREVATSLEGSTAVAAVRGPVQLEHTEHDGAVAVVQGRPYFTDPRLGELAHDRGVAEALIRGFRDAGPRVLERLHGGFAVALVDRLGNRALVGIDRIGGRHPVSYRITDRGLVFATSSDAIQLHPLGRSAVDPQSIYGYVYFHVVPGPDTIWKGVRRLMPGTYLYVEGERAEPGTYWEPDYREHADASTEELKEEFLRILRSGVRRCSSGHQVGCFLSGGTDSTTVAGLVAEVAGRPARTYSMGFEIAEYDELRYAREAARHFATDHREYYLTPADVLELTPKVAEASTDPFGNESALAAYACARMAQEDGVECLLGGDGGDELFAGNERYATQNLFESYSHLPRLLRERLIEPVLLSSGLGRLPLLRKGRNYVRQAKVPMPHRTQTYNYIERFGASEIFDSEFLASIDLQHPRTLLEETYRDARAEGTLNRHLALDMRFTLADNDLPKVSRMCELAGIGVEYPLLTDELVEFACRVPPSLKLKGRRLRWFWKHALKDFLPVSTLTKKKQGMGVPVGMWIRDHRPLRELARDALDRLGARGIVRPEFLGRLLRLHETDHAHYYGGLVWVLLQLELWLQSHADRVTFPDRPEQGREASSMAFKP